MGCTNSKPQTSAGLDGDTFMELVRRVRAMPEEERIAKVQGMDGTLTEAEQNAFVKIINMVREEEDEAEDDEEDAVGFESIVISFLALEAEKQGEILDSLDDEARSHLLQLAEEQQLNPLLLTNKVVELSGSSHTG
mmetsp:Transcript_30029/g.59634  ORF Transcript_30029/g.59634 Transcript_30029/m.59634 type:complete len:136 (+) Transcript_30029:722-1129(+)